MLIKYYAVVTNGAGDIQEGASVTVTITNGGTTATIYSSSAGASATNPLTSDSDGKVEFWAPPRGYTLTSGSNSFPMVGYSPVGPITSAAAASSSGAVTLNLLATGHFYTDMTEDITSVTISNPPDTGEWHEFLWEVTQPNDSPYTAKTITFPGSVSWFGGTELQPDAAQNTKTLYRWFTRDGGTTWLVEAVGVGSTGDAIGAASSTDNALARFDGAGGKTIQNSGWTLSDADLLTAGGNLDLDGNNLDGGGGEAQDVVLVNHRTKAASVSSSSGTVTLDFAAANYFYITLTEDVTGWTLNNAPSTAEAFEVYVEFTQATGSPEPQYSITYPASFKWAGGTDHSMSTGNGAIDLIKFTSRDGGSTYIASTVAANVS